jgi:hypothetical protein
MTRRGRDDPARWDEADMRTRAHEENSVLLV